MPTAFSVSIYIPIFLPHFFFSKWSLPRLGSFLACVNTLSCTYQQPSRGINPAGDMSIIRAQVLIVLSAKGISHHSRCNQMKLDLLTFAANFQPQIGGIGLLLHSYSRYPKEKPTECVIHTWWKRIGNKNRQTKEFQDGVNPSERWVWKKEV